MKLLFNHLLCSLSILFLAISCNPLEPSKPSYVPDPVGSFARGADCSWITEQEKDGVLFADSLGYRKEGMLLMREYGINAIRLRVWVNHTTGWCNKADVLVKAKRAHDLGLRLMIDFHYSDNFTDPSKQNTPAQWENYTLDELKQAVHDHTVDVLSTLAEQNITPEWVQVGNETTNGMLWPTGRLWDSSGDRPNGWANYAALERAGYDAVKSVFPDTKVVVHIDNAYKNNNWFYRKLLQNNGRFDMIGLSHYPMKKEWSGLEWNQMNSEALKNIKLLYNEFKVPVLLSEIGTLGAANKESASAEVMADILSKLKPFDWFAGAFYWEPQVFNGWRPQEYVPLGWGAYDMGAFKTITVRLPGDEKTYTCGTPNAAFCILSRRETAK